MPNVTATAVKIIPTALTHHGDTRTDNYYWMRDRNDPDVIAFLERENARTQEALATHRELQEKLYKELLSHVAEDDAEVPFRRGRNWYYKRTEKGRPYAFHCRKAALDAPEELLLNENALAEGHEYFSLGNFKISPDEQLLAYSVDTEGNEQYTTRVRNLASGGDLPDSIAETYYSIEWTNDSKSFYYVTLDATKRPYCVWRHRLGGTSDELIFEETDQRFEVELFKSRDDRYIFIHSESKAASETRFARASDENPVFGVVWPRRDNVLYEVESRGDDFYVSTNDGAVEFRVLHCTAQNPTGCTEFLPHRPGTTVEGLDAFAGFLAVYERQAGLPQIRIHRFADNEAHYVSFHEAAYALHPAENEVFDTSSIRFVYTSLVTPPSVFEYDMEAKAQTLLRQRPVPLYDPEQYTTERLTATARDGTQVPISLVYRKDHKPGPESPLLLYGYGSYGIRNDPDFRAERLPLLDRGFTYALAHIRGGSDLGRAWYENGKLLKKLNTFHDFIDCADFVIQRGYTSRRKLVIQGGSAGGMLVGCVLNMRPDLFHSAVAMVPFVDTLTTCLDPTLPLTIGEYEEWGNASQAEFYRYIKCYSPYDNVRAVPYPHLLITAGLNDPRVSYWEPAKWFAKMTELRKDANMILLKTNMGAGHFGASGRYGRLRELAEIYSFIFKSLETPRAYES